MTGSHVHLNYKWHPACGLVAGRLTQDPSKVTCTDCRKTIQQADAEIRWSQQPRSVTERRKQGSE